MLNPFFAAVTLCTLLATQAPALTLQFPGDSQLLAERVEPQARLRLPTAPWVATGLPVKRIDGDLAIRSYRIEAAVSTLALLTSLRAQLEAAGLKIIFECETEGCGGFDFRFEIDVLPEPDMHVDLGDYRFLSAEGPRGQSLTLMVSRSASAGYVQLAEITPTKTALQTETAPGAALPANVTPQSLPPVGAPDLKTQGSVVIEGLVFASGSSDLSEGVYPALEALAQWLKAHPDMTVALVGHTDAAGGLEGNIALSQRRARSVRARLIDRYGIPAAQIEAQGVGYLSPRAPNLTDAGREANRRVEAVLTSTE